MKLALALLLPSVALAAPATRSKLGPDGAHARVTALHAGELRPAREVVGRRDEPLTAEERTAREIEKLLRGPLRYGTTGLFVADAHTGEPLFAVNADDRLNPASNVKMISTATALELLGPEFRYPTRVLGPQPVDGVIHGDVYLMGSYDPTLTASDLDELAKALVEKGVSELDGDVVIGTDPTRDGIYRATVPIEVTAGAPGELAIASQPVGMDLVTFNVTAKTAKSGGAHLTYKAETIGNHVQLTIAGSIGRGSRTSYTLATQERTADAAYALRAALRAQAIMITGDVKTAELGDFISDAVAAGELPAELARHESAQLVEIVTHVNKWSINWLADRVIMTAAALSHRQQPSMELALDAMYEWLGRHPHLGKSDMIVDTGSGLSYHTQVTTKELVSIVRSAAGFSADSDSQLAKAWLGSLSIAGTDGTLSHRFRTSDMRGRIHGKTGTLSTVIALSGILDIDPKRPLAFSLVTNSDTPLSKGAVRKAHEQVIGVLCKYLAKGATLAPLVLPVAVPKMPETEDLDESVPDAKLDAETSGQ